MDQIDKDILNIIQTGFPIAARPYAVIGEKVGLSEDDTFDRIMRLKNENIIRRIGATFDSRKLHFTSTLCALKCPPEKLEDVAAIVSGFPQVTHNYQRNHAYNLWFTVIAESKEKLQAILDEISERGGVDKVRSMPASQIIKIKVDFKFKDKKETQGAKA
ncbi:MAG: AsnC family transcriptional regulator [Nitrospinota bacterium]